MWDAVFEQRSMSAQAVEKIIALADEWVDLDERVKIYTAVNTPKARERVIKLADWRFAAGDVKEGQELYALACQTPSAYMLALCAENLLKQTNVIAALRLYEYIGQQPPADMLATATEESLQQKKYESTFAGYIALNTADARTKLLSLAEMLSTDEDQMHTAARMYAEVGTEEAIANIMSLGDKLAAAGPRRAVATFDTYGLAMEFEEDEDTARAAVTREKFLSSAIELTQFGMGFNGRSVSDDAIDAIRELGIDADVAKRLIEIADRRAVSREAKKRIYSAVGNEEACTKLLALGDMELAMRGPYHDRRQEAFETYLLVRNCGPCGQPREHGVTHE